ncbi:hypothetical protein LC55x_3365 [Lysobacter capsici]|nr:hypothetical protein LC55x_3365 [Lysobacter capsici]
MSEPAVERATGRSDQRPACRDKQVIRPAPQRAVPVGGFKRRRGHADRRRGDATMWSHRRRPRNRL